MIRAFYITIGLISLGLLQGCGGGSTAPVENAPTAPAPPQTPTGNVAPTITGEVPLGKENSIFEYVPVVSDANGDPVTLTASNLPEWLQFDSSTATFTGIPAAAHIGSHAGIEITASDGTDQTQVTFTIDVVFDELEQALRTGDSAYLATEPPIIDAIKKSIEDNQTRFTTIKNQIFGLDPSGALTSNSLTDISWDPTHDSALLQARFGSNEPILTTNAVSNPSYIVQERVLAIVGEKESSRYAVFGGNPIRNSYRSNVAVSNDMSALINNTLTWLSTPQPAQTLNVVLSQLDESTFFPDQSAIRDWLDNRFGYENTYNQPGECDNDRLNQCISESTDLLIISSFLSEDDSSSNIAHQVFQAMNNGVPVIYFHLDGHQNELSEALFKLFDVDYHGDNYWRKLSIENVDASVNSTALPAEIDDIKTLVTLFQNQSFLADLSLCEDKSCPSGSLYYDEFLGPVESLQGQLRDMDLQGIRLFETSDYRFQKLLILLGDFYRKRARFPMDSTITNRTLFLRSLYADHTVYYNRSVNPAQTDMGNFSRSNFSHITPQSFNKTITSKLPFRSTGAYALPGNSFTVSRTDTSSSRTWVFVNTLRPGATHEFESFGYSRPKYLQSSAFELKSGETLSLTSPHGGTIQVGFDRNDAEVKLEFADVGTHPYWESEEDSISFSNAIEAAHYDWAEFVTEHFEVHSTLDKMRSTLKQTRWNNAEALATAITVHAHNYPLALAGFEGPDVQTLPDVYDFAAANNLDVRSVDAVKHMNADQATCGYGCSGNPYDAYWFFDPLGHGDLHEIGHGLERNRFRFNGWDSHSSTNYYSYYSKYRFYATTGDITVLDGCEALPFAKVFYAAQQSAKTDEPVEYMQAANLTSWSDGASIFLQLMMRLQEDQALADGWLLLPRLHLIEREFALSDDDDQSWLLARDNLGFEGMDRTDARRLSNNDWLSIAISHASGRDVRNYLSMWGLAISEVASEHIGAKKLPELPVAIHVLKSNAYCLGLDHPSVPVDGNQTWPYTD